MPKLAKQKYYSKSGEEKINSYVINIPKRVINETNIKETDEVKIYSKDNKIIIERLENNYGIVD